MDTNTTLWVFGAIATTVAALKAIEYVYGKTPTAKTEKRVSALEVNQKSDFEHLKALDRQVNHMDDRLNKLEGSLDQKVDNINESIEMLASFLSKTTIGTVTGKMSSNDLVDESQKLNDYFIKRDKT